MNVPLLFLDSNLDMGYFVVTLLIGGIIILGLWMELIVKPKEEKERRESNKRWHERERQVDLQNKNQYNELKSNESMLLNSSALLEKDITELSRGISQKDYNIKKYGKRKIPRNIEEFEDLIGPSYFKGDYAKSVDILLSFWKRKGKSQRSAYFIAYGLFACSFKGNLNIDGRFILQKYHTGPNDIFSYDNFNEFLPYFFDLFLIKYKSVPNFLNRFYNKLEWEIPIDLIENYKNITYLESIAPKEVYYNKSWNYGKENNKVEIMTNALISFELDEIIDKATKEFRLSKGLSAISTKWTNEQYLLDKIKITFPKEIVIGQGSPNWLERQRFDIWLPELNSAVEYNGIQHYEPVELFGGIEGFEATKQRDKIKRLKCEENNTDLLEVREGYRFEDVENWIKSKINSQALFKK